MTVLLRWVLLCHSRTDQKQFIYLIIKNCIQGRICIIKPALRYYLITIWWHKRSLFYLIFEKLLGGNAPERIHRAQFPGELTKEDSNSGCGVGGGGEFTEGGFSWYQFSEWTSPFKHVKKMTAVIKHTVFDK